MRRRSVALSSSVFVQVVICRTLSYTIGQMSRRAVLCEQGLTRLGKQRCDEPAEQDDAG